MPAAHPKEFGYSMYARMTSHSALDAMTHGGRPAQPRRLGLLHDRVTVAGHPA